MVFYRHGLYHHGVEVETSPPTLEEWKTLRLCHGPNPSRTKEEEREVVSEFNHFCQMSRV